MQKDVDTKPPEWFVQNIKAPCSSHYVDVQNCSVHYLRWEAQPITTASRGAGIIFVHGNGAHAHWWSFLAPFFTRENACIAVSNSGNGESGWRDEYTIEIWAEEVLAAAKDAGMLDETHMRCRPVVVAHSMGVIIAMLLAKRFGSSLSGLVLLDEMPRPPFYFEALKASGWRAPTVGGREQHVVRPHTVKPRDRFVLMPPQPERNRYILDFIADHSVKEEGDGWVWSFDPQKLSKLPRDEHFPVFFTKSLSVEAVRALAVKTTFIVGERSAICSKDLVEWARHELGGDIPFIEVHDSAHHIMFDQPLALVAAIHATLAEWRRSQLITPGGLTLPRLESRASHSSFDGNTSKITPKLPMESPKKRSKL